MQHPSPVMQVPNPEHDMELEMKSDITIIVPGSHLIISPGSADIVRIWQLGPLIVNLGSEGGAYTWKLELMVTNFKKIYITFTVKIRNKYMNLLSGNCL